MCVPSFSPYETALGPEAPALHPKLRTYFGVIPQGHVGVGVGVFDEFGVPSRWKRVLLWPILRLLERRGVLSTAYARDVPFRIENRTLDENAAVRTRATRTISLPGGHWTMSDSVFASQGQIVDQLGTPWIITARFDVGVSDGALTLVSRSVGLRLAGMRIRVPAMLAPTVRLTERYDDQLGRHHVDLSMRAPVLGNIYAYRGSFDYDIRQEAITGES